MEKSLSKKSTLHLDEFLDCRYNFLNQKVTIIGKLIEIKKGYEATHMLFPLPFPCKWKRNLILVLGCDKGILNCYGELNGTIQNLEDIIGKTVEITGKFIKEPLSMRVVSFTLGLAYVNPRSREYIFLSNDLNNQSFRLIN